MVYDSRKPGMDKQSGAAGWFITQETLAWHVVRASPAD